MARSIADRLQSLEQQKARLAAQEMRLKEEARKARSRRLYRSGELVEKAGLLDLDEPTLLGALMSNAATLAADPDARARWAADGERALYTGPNENDVKEALTITFPTPLGRAFL